MKRTDPNLWTVFVGGPKHGHTIEGQPEHKGELYRPFAPTGEPNEVYKAVEIHMAIPSPVDPDAIGETYNVMAWAAPEVDPDESPQRRQMFSQAIMDALIRAYAKRCGVHNVGAPTQATETVRVAWCPECQETPADDYPWLGTDGQIGTETVFPNLRDRAVSMASHKSTTGHTVQWADKEQ